MNCYGIFVSQIHTKLCMQNKQNKFSFTYLFLEKDDPITQHVRIVILKEENT